MTNINIQPTPDQLAKDTVTRLKRFSDHLDSGVPIGEAYSCRKIILDIEVEEYTADMVREVRALLKVSQALFARFLNVSVSTVQKWERGVKPPDGAASRFMDEIRHNPQYFRERFASMARLVESSR